MLQHRKVVVASKLPGRNRVERNIWIKRIKNRARLWSKLSVAPKANFGFRFSFFKLFQYRYDWRNVAARAPADCENSHWSSPLLVMDG